VPQFNADFRREVMELACKRSSSHDGGLLHDPLHKGTCFPSVPQKDREDGRQWVSAQSEVPISSFPLPFSRHQAVREPEIITGLSSQATTSTQPTDLLLQQLMAEMKYLRGEGGYPPHGVAASLQTSPEVPEPSSQTFSSSHRANSFALSPTSHCPCSTFGH
jgi:hypothetical protein